LGEKTETYKVNGRTFHKQIHGQKVEKAVTFGDLNSFSANERSFNEGYHFASNNCQDYQERIRSELLDLPVHKPLRTTVTKKVVKFMASPPTKDSVRSQSSGSASAVSGHLNKSSDSDDYHCINLDNTTLPSALPSGHGNSSHRTSTMSPGKQAFSPDDIIDGCLPSLFSG
jgi:hypothetical protein